MLYWKQRKATHDEEFKLVLRYGFSQLSAFVAIADQLEWVRADDPRQEVEVAPWLRVTEIFGGT